MAKRAIKRVHVADARPGIDAIEYNEEDGCNYLVDSQGAYAPVRIANERDDFERFCVNTERDDIATLGRLAQVLRQGVGQLTAEQRTARLEVINGEWRKRYGDAKFVVEAT